MKTGIGTVLFKVWRKNMLKHSAKKKTPTCWLITSELMWTLNTSILSPSIVLTGRKMKEESICSPLSNPLWLPCLYRTPWLLCYARIAAHVGSPRLARITHDPHCAWKGAGVGGGQISKLQIANATDTATYSKSQLPESTKLCKLVLKVRFALRYVRKHTKS